MYSTAFASMVRLASPRKSIFSRPIFSSAFWGYWVMTSVSLLADLLQRRVVDQRIAGDDDAGGVGGGVAGDALDGPGGVDQPRDRGSLSYSCFSSLT